MAEPPPAAAEPPATALPAGNGLAPSGSVEMSEKERDEAVRLCRAFQPTGAQLKRLEKYVTEVLQSLSLDIRYSVGITSMR